MNAILIRVTAAVLVSLPLAIVNAQTPTVKPSGQPPDATPSPAKSDQTVIVGCLTQTGPAAGGDTKPDSRAATADDYFVRTPAITIPTGSSVTVGSPGATPGSATTTSAGTPTATTLYRITGIDGEQLRPHLGHRVELRGHLTPNAPATAAKTTVDAAGRAKTTVDTRMDVAGVLHATTMKMVSANCP